MIICLEEAAELMKEKSAASGEAFAKKYNLEMLPTNIRHGKGRACLFVKQEVLKRAAELNRDGMPTAEEYNYLGQMEYLVSRITELERKINRVLLAFDLPVDESTDTSL